MAAIGIIADHPAGRPLDRATSRRTSGHFEARLEAKTPRVPLDARIGRRLTGAGSFRGGRIMTKPSAIALLALTLCGSGVASPVVVAGSGYLSTASGVYHVGDPFSFSTRYDDAAPRVALEPGVFTAYSSLMTAPIVFTVRGDTIVAGILYNMVVSANHFAIGTPSDYSPTSEIDLDLMRLNLSEYPLPTAAELQGASGSFSFVYRAAPGLAGAGSGSFVLSRAAVPEPTSSALLLAGIGLLVVARRRRRAVPLRRRSASAPLQPVAGRGCASMTQPLQ
jgi:hypothetical protein